MMSATLAMPPTRSPNGSPFSPAANWVIRSVSCSCGSMPDPSTSADMIGVKRPVVRARKM